MKVRVNGELYETLAETLTVSELLKELEKKWKLDLSGGVVLLNDEIVKKYEWETTKIANDYHLEILTFVSGG